MRNRWIGAIGSAVVAAVLVPVLAACETTTRPEGLSLECTGEVPAPAPGMPTAPPAPADPGPGLRSQPRERGTVPGGRLYVVGGTGYAVAPDGAVTARRVGRTDTLWTVPAPQGLPGDNLTVVAAQPGRPDLVAITSTAPGRPAVVRLAAADGRVVRTCLARGVDERRDRVELSADGRVLLATRTTTKTTGLSGTERMTDRVVEARDTADGTVLWSRRAGDFVQDGRRVYLRAGHELSARDIATGEPAWTVATADLGDPRRDPAQPLFLAGGRVYAYAPAGGVIVAHAAADGARAWSEPAGVLRAVHGAVVVHDGGVITDGPRGVVTRVAQPYTEGDAASGIVVRELHDVTAGTAVYRESQGEATRLVRVRDGRRVAFPVDGPIVKATVAGDVAYVLSGQGRLTLTAYDASSGEVLWRMAAPGGEYQGQVSLVPFERGLYVGDTREGHLLG